MPEHLLLQCIARLQAAIRADNDGAGNEALDELEQLTVTLPVTRELISEGGAAPHAGKALKKAAKSLSQEHPSGRIQLIRLRVTALLESWQAEMQPSSLPTPIQQARRKVILDRLHSARKGAPGTHEQVFADAVAKLEAEAGLWEEQDADIQSLCDALKWYADEKRHVEKATRDRAKLLFDTWSSKLPVEIAAELRSPDGACIACWIWREAERQWETGPPVGAPVADTAPSYRRFCRTEGYARLQAQKPVWNHVSATCDQRRQAASNLLGTLSERDDYDIWVEEERSVKKQGATGEIKTEVRGHWKCTRSFLSDQPSHGQQLSEEWQENQPRTQLVQRASELAVFSHSGELLLRVPLAEQQMTDAPPLPPSETIGLYLRRTALPRVVRDGHDQTVQLDSSRADYANRSNDGSYEELTAEQRQKELSYKELHRGHLARTAGERKLGEMGGAVFLEAQDASFAVALICQEAFRPDQMYIPNFDPFVCCRILMAVDVYVQSIDDDRSASLDRSAPRVFCATLGQCLKALDAEKVHVSFMWADYCGTVEKYPQQDLPFFFNTRLPVEECVLAVTYSYRGGKAYKNAIAGDKKEGEAYKKATVEQSVRNVAQTFSFTEQSMCAAAGARSPTLPSLRMLHASRSLWPQVPAEGD